MAISHNDKLLYTATVTGDIVAHFFPAMGADPSTGHAEYALLRHIAPGVS